MKKFIKKRKKLVVVIAILLILVIAGFAVKASIDKKIAAAVATQNTEQVSTVELKNLVSSVSATGVIESGDSKSITSTLSGVKINQVNVEVGDYVSADDIICSFDSTDIETNLDNAKTNLNATKSKTSIDVTSAQRSLQEAEASRDINAERNNKDVADAWTTYQKAITDFNTTEVDYYAAKGTTSTRKSEMDASLTRLNGYTAAATTAKNNFSGKLTELTTAYGTICDFSDISLTTSVWNSKNGTDYVALGSGGTPTDATAIDIYLTALKSFQNDYNLNTTKTASESSAYATYQQNYATAQSSEASAKSKYDAAQTTVDSKLSSYNQLVRSQTDTTRNDSSTITAKSDSLKTTKINAGTSALTYEQQVSQYEEQLENSQVKSPISGVVTAVNVTAGDSYAGGALVTIEDDTDFQISTEIDEYNISKIKTGQKVIVKTNATGDLEMDGTVLSIAPRATVSTGSSNVTYTVKISLDTKNADIRLDMTAKLSIILESRENVLAVPYDAVITGDDGKKYVQVYQDTTTGRTNTTGTATADTTAVTTADTTKSSATTGVSATKKVYVTTGIENDYYIEVISDELEAGMKVLIPSAESTGSISDMIGTRGAMGGF